MSGREARWLGQDATRILRVGTRGGRGCRGKLRTMSEFGYAITNSRQRAPEPINRWGPRHVCPADLGYHPPPESGRLDLLSRDLVHPVPVGLRVANPHLPPRQEHWD
jgi:hypothetical protein